MIYQLLQNKGNYGLDETQNRVQIQLCHQYRLQKIHSNLTGGTASIIGMLLMHF